MALHCSFSALPPENPVNVGEADESSILFSLFLSAKYTSDAAYRTVNNLRQMLDQRSPKPLA